MWSDCVWEGLLVPFYEVGRRLKSDILWKRSGRRRIYVVGARLFGCRSHVGGMRFCCEEVGMPV